MNHCCFFALSVSTAIVIVALCVSTAFIGTNTANPIHYQIFVLREITIFRSGFATTGTPMSKTNDKKLYYNSTSALEYATAYL